MKICKFYFAMIFLLSLQCCNSDYTKSLGKDYFYRDEGGDIVDILCKKAKGGQIPSKVVSFDFDHKFIIAKQKPKLPQDPLYDKDYKYSKGDNEFYYWLIVKDKHIVLGPFDEIEYLEIRKKYEVSEKLKFEE